MSAVVTGIGITAPNGIGVDAYWSATVSGRSAIGPITRFDASPYPVRLAGVIADFDAGALGRARRQVRQGTPMVLTGGHGSAMCPMGLVSQLPTGRLSTRDTYIPFAEDACGYLPGEGGAILVVEDAARARERGRRTYGEIAGYAATFDPPPGSGREPGLLRAAQLALADADVVADDVDVVFADAAGIPADYAVEAHALAKLFGPRGVPVTAPKTMTGRLNSGACVLDVATALLAIRDGIIPPTVNVPRVAAGSEIDLVTGDARAAQVRTALVLARGAGGFNAAVVVRPAHD